MAWQSNPTNEVYKIVVTSSPFSSNTLPIGTIAYWQDGVYGAGKGLLLALTNTPLIRKVIQTSNGLRIV